MKIFIGILLMLVGLNAKAQVNMANYGLTKSINTYSAISGGTVIASGPYNDKVSNAVSLGGNFTFGDVVWTQCYISSNGFLSFGAVPDSTNYTPLSILGSTTGVVSVFGGNGSGSAVAGATPEISYLNVGGATGEFVVQFKDHANYPNRSTERLNFQIRLNLSTNQITVMYGACTPPGVQSSFAANKSAQVGIRGNSTNWASNVNNLAAINAPVGTTCNWADAVTGFNNSSALLFSASSGDNVAVATVNGLTFTWTAGVIAPVRNFAAITGKTTSSATVNWTASSGANQYNIQYRITGVCGWTNFSGNPVFATVATLTGLTSGTRYQVRVQASDGTNNAIWSHIPDSTGSDDGYSNAGTFRTAFFPPVNDDCSNAISVPVNSGNLCLTTVSGTVAGATPSPGPPGLCGVFDDDVWFKFVATRANHQIYFNNVANGGSNPNMIFQVLDSCNASSAIICNGYLYHAVTGLIPGKTYYIRVATETTTPVQITTFDICISTPPDMSYVSSTTSHTATASFNAGTINNQILKVNVKVTGANNPLTVTQFNLNTGLSTNAPNDILAARIYYTGPVNIDLLSPENIAASVSVIQFGPTIMNPSGNFIVYGSQQLDATNGDNYFRVLYDLKCDGNVNNAVDVLCDSFIVNAVVYVPTVTAPVGSKVIKAALPLTYTTEGHGDWSNPGTWVCGAVPPNNPDAIINIYHNITVTTPGNIAGNINILDNRTLTIASGDLTMGSSSLGGLSGNSNKLLSVGGALTITGGVLNLNGGVIFKSSVPAKFNMSGGTFNIDPNDGTAATSFASGNPVFYLMGTTVNVTGGNINFLDPAYNQAGGNGQAIIGYITSSPNIQFSTGCAVTFGGGDDQNPLNNDGFLVASNLGSGAILEIGNAVVAGGRYTDKRAVTTGPPTYNHVTKFKNVTINAGSELALTSGSAPLFITGNLINNGFLTVAPSSNGSGLFFANCDYPPSTGIYAVNIAQNLSGSGFFKKSLTDADPTLQVGNIVDGLTVANTSASPGLTLGMPVTATGFLKLISGKINTTAANFLALGNGLTLPGNSNPLTASSGILYGSATAAPTSLGSYLPGGWVNGTFKRWTASITNGQGILPLGSDTIRPAQLSFTVAPSAPGYLVGQWFDTDATTAGLPLNEPAINPPTVDEIVKGFWQISRDASLTGGTYDGTFLNTKAPNVISFSNTTLIKRQDASSPWLLEGTHVATTGTNSSLTVKRTNLINLSEFAIAGKGGSAIPVTLIDFTALRTGKVNVIRWSTSQEINSKYFIIERSSDGRNFTSIAQIAAAGYSAITSSYNYTDINPNIGINYYRLRIVDKDNSAKLSWVRSVRNEGGADVAIYPNPVKDVMTVIISADKIDKGTIIISDVNGKVIYTNSISVTQGNNSLSVKLNNVAAGSYVIKVQLSDDVIVKKFDKL